MERRRLLQVLSSATALGLAGCIGGQPADDDGTPSDPPATFTATGGDCGEQVDTAAVGYADGVLTVEGTTWGNDGCYRPRLVSVTLEEEVLTVRVDAERADEKEACVQCITELDYRLEVAVEPRPTEVEVIHRGEPVPTAEY